jgi:nucleotide-binding universal stress UspA family protein
MTPKVIISYDGTANDQDALVLGRLFGNAGAELELAYVRHSTEDDPGRERAAQREAERLLESGAESLGRPDAARHVVLSGSTGTGLRRLAERVGADVVVFGSEYRTAPGHVAPGTSAQRLLEGGPAAIALAPAGARTHDELEVETIGAAAADGDHSVRGTADALAESVGARVVDGESADLIVVGSRPDAPQGRVLVSAANQYLIETAERPVLVVPRGVAVPFRVPAGVA